MRRPGHVATGRATRPRDAAGAGRAARACAPIDARPRDDVTDVFVCPGTVARIFVRAGLPT
eukprot:scaffold3036_cov414-Prasinococcus_capsulatus_cf.AAC.27